MNHLKYYRQLIQYFGILKGFTYHVASKLNLKLVISARILEQKIFLRTNSRDFQIALSNLIEGEFQELPLDAINVHDGIIVDAGGYIGTSAIALSLAFPNKIIFCIEPDVTNFRLLQRNTENLSNVIILNAALAPTGTNMAMLFNRTSEYGYTIVKEPLDNRLAVPIVMVDCIAINDILSEFKSEISLLKMDIEGGEASVFAESASWIEKINCIYVELHDRIDDSCTSTFEAAASNMYVWGTKSEKLCRTREFQSSLK